MKTTKDACWQIALLLTFAASAGDALAGDDDDPGQDAAAVLREIADSLDGAPPVAEGQGSLWRANGSKIYYNSGNVGIGIGNPSSKLHVNSPAQRAIYGQSSAGNAQVLFGNSTSSSGRGWGVYGTSRGRTGRGVYGNATSTSGRNYGVFGRTASANGYAGYFIGGRNYFQGAVGIGTNAPGELLEVNGNAVIDGDLDVDDDITIEESLYLDPPGATTKGFVEYRIDARDYLSVGGTGGLRLWSDAGDVDCRHPDTNAWQDVRAASFTTQSARRSKRDIDYLDPEDLRARLDQVLALKPATYRLRSDDDKPVSPDRRRLGLIAEETPDAIRAGEGVDVYAFVTTLAAATIELAREKDREIERLETRLAEMEAVLERLENADER